MNVPERELSELISKIRRCERAYTGCFAEPFEDKRVIRYRDDLMSDMYDHNCTYIKGTPSLDDLLQLIAGEIRLCREENLGYCKITMDEMQHAKGIEEFDDKLQIEHYGQYVYMPYVYMPAEPPGWALKTDCDIRKIADEVMVEDLVLLDKIQYAEACGGDFCARRARSRGQVYLSNTSIESYICYYEGEPAGNCDLFLYDGMAKIEDFTVLPKFQRRGLGTAILEHLIVAAFSKGARTIYLTTDEEDTPKEMYMKLGFEKVSDSYALLRKL
jgi:spore maturation protein CgeE